MGFGCQRSFEAWAKDRSCRPDGACRGTDVLLGERGLDGAGEECDGGLGSPRRIVPVTMLLLMGQVLPVIAAVLWVAFWWSYGGGRNI